MDGEPLKTVDDSDCRNDEDTIIIRPYKPKDKLLVFNPVWRALMSNNWRYFWISIQNWVNQMVMITITLVLYSIFLNVPLIIAALSLYLGLILAAWTVFHVWYQWVVCKDVHNVRQYYRNEDGGEFWVIELAGEVIGCAGIVPKAVSDALFHPADPTPRVADYIDKKVAILKRVSLLPAFKNRGIGRKLMEEVIAYCKERNYDEIHCCASVAQKRALSLFRRCDFEEVAVYPIMLMTFWNMEVHEFVRPLKGIEKVTYYKRIN